MSDTAIAPTVALEDRIRITVTDGVADVRLVRSDKMNALDDAMFQALVDTGEHLKTLPGLRAVVLSGEGRGFCAGLDMGNFSRMASGERKGGAGLVEVPRTPAGANRAQQAAYVWREIPVPVIAAVHGVALGGGFQVCLGADMRFVTADVKMSILEIKWGLVPDMAGMVLLRGLVRDDLARELCFSGRIFNGEEAVSLGVATRVCADPHADAMVLAREIAGRNPHAIRAAKRLFDVAADADPATILKAESVEQAALIGSPNQIEAVMSSMQKRAGDFADV
jgi:enoyl-CoA hydratase/carnithine racemase